MIDCSTNIDQKMSQINNSLQQLVKQLPAKETNVIVPQLIETNDILRTLQNKDVQEVVLQNDKAFQIEYVNKPTNLDYMTAIGTVGTVFVSLFLTFWNNRDKRKAFCKCKHFEVLSEHTTINIVGTSQKGKDTISFKTEALKFSIFNKCDFTKLEIEKVYIDFFTSVDGEIFSQELKKEINIYSEREIIVPLSIKYRGNQENSNLMGYFTIVKKYADERNLKLNLSSNPKVVLFTNFGEFNIYATREAKKYIKREFYDFIKKNTTHHSINKEQSNG